jgi:hypothetical protein
MSFLREGKPYSRIADEKLAEEQKKETPQKKGLELADLTRGSHWRSWGGGLPAMIAINNACLKFDFQIVKVLCSSLQCLVHRANQFPEGLRTELILIRQLATHLAHWEASLSLHSRRRKQFCLVDFIQWAQYRVLGRDGLSAFQAASCIEGQGRNREGHVTLAPARILQLSRSDK